MRVVLAILAMALGLSAAPARASWFIDANLFGEGSKFVQTCTFNPEPTSCIDQTTAFTVSILWLVLIPEVIGVTHFDEQVAGRAFGRTALASFDIEYDGNALYGRNFVYSEAGGSRTCSQGATCFTGVANASASTFSVNVHPGTTGPIPEPATWGMMILGFGVIGAAMRRRSYRASIYFG